MRGLLVPPTGPVQELDLSGGYQVLSDAVGGMIEALGVLGRHDLTGYGNDMAKILQPPMPPNDRATELVYGDPKEAYRRGEEFKAAASAAGVAVIEADPPGLPILPFVAGPIVVCGFDPNTGDNLAIPDDVAELILAMEDPG